MGAVNRKGAWLGLFGGIFLLGLLLTVWGCPDTSLLAVFTAAEHMNLTVTAGLNGITSPSGTISVSYGVATPITATPNTGYAFSGWYVTGGTNVSFGSASSASTTVTLTNGPATILAYFGYAFTWTDQTLAGSRTWGSIASSSDGTNLAACVNGGDIWTSTDGGAHWTDQTLAGSRYWDRIASCSDGTHLAAMDNGGNSGGDIWTSTDSGVHWTDQTLAGSRNWSFVTSSSDGTRLVASVWNGDIFTGQ